MQLSIPPGLDEALLITQGVDDVLMSGFGRLGKRETAALQALVSAVADTPLGDAVAQAVQALLGGELLAHHMALVAAARASIEGARHDALLESAAGRLNLKIVSPKAEQTSKPSMEANSLMESARQWLVEIALAGLTQLEGATIAPAVESLRNLQECPELSRLAAVMTGFANELLHAAPTSSVEEPPARRWTDLWSQALLGTFKMPANPGTRTIKGVLYPLGADVRHHEHLVSVVVHGLLEEGEDRLLVRTTLSAWKVDAVSGNELWRLLGETAPQLLTALAKPTALNISDATLLDDGNLLWDGTCTTGPAFVPWKVDLAGAMLNAPMPRDRHPLNIALPILADKEELAGIDMTRVSPHANLSVDEVKGAQRVFGLLRFDDQFSVQPLAVLQGKKTRGPAEGIIASMKLKQPALDILRERASKLLRA